MIVIRRMHKGKTSPTCLSFRAFFHATTLLFPTAMRLGDIGIQPGRERDRPNVGVVAKVAPTLHVIEVLLCLFARTGEMNRHRAITAEIEGTMIRS
jgi:hypothetical protein